MAAWHDVLRRITREVERQGATTRTTRSGGIIIRNPETGATASIHASPSAAARQRHNIEQTIGYAGYELPSKFKL